LLVLRKAFVKIPRLWRKVDFLWELLLTLTLMAFSVTILHLESTFHLSTFAMDFEYVMVYIIKLDSLGLNML